MKRLALVLSLIFIPALCWGMPICPDKSDLLEVVCVKVVDGDTAWFEDLDEYIVHKVRFIGIDTPETRHPTQGVQHFGPEASAFTVDQLDGKTVWLEYDVEWYDRYARHLCYVWMEDGSLFNLTLIRQGYAVLMTYPPNIKYVDYFAAAQESAREESLGLWAETQAIYQ